MRRLWQRWMCWRVSNFDEDGGTSNIFAVPLGEGLEQLQRGSRWRREVELGANTCSLLLVGDTSTLHFERSLGGAEYVFLPASKPSLGSSSPKGRTLSVRDKHCGDAVQKMKHACASRWRRVTVGRLELEGLAVLVGERVGCRVERHAAGKDERLSSCFQKQIRAASCCGCTVTISGEATKE